MVFLRCFGDFFKFEMVFLSKTIINNNKFGPILAVQAALLNKIDEKLIDILALAPKKYILSADWAGLFRFFGSKPLRLSLDG